MNLPRFFLSDLGPNRCLELSEAESHHLARVLRLQAGDSVEVFDGQGSRASATVRVVHKNATVIETGTLARSSPGRMTRITIATSLPKGDRQKWLIEKLTELGVDRVIPLETERGVAQPTDQAIERLERVALEACKQSRNDWLLKIESPATLGEVGAGLKADAAKLLAHPYAVRRYRQTMENIEMVGEKNDLTEESAVVPGMRALQQWFPQKLPQEIVIGIGPEGGFTDTEVEHSLPYGWLPWVLTNNILRVETAVMMAAILAIDFVTTLSCTHE